MYRRSRHVSSRTRTRDCCVTASLLSRTCAACILAAHVAQCPGLGSGPQFPRGQRSRGKGQKKVLAEKRKWVLITASHPPGKSLRLSTRICSLLLDVCIGSSRIQVGLPLNAGELEELTSFGSCFSTMCLFLWQLADDGGYPTLTHSHTHTHNTRSLLTQNRLHPSRNHNLSSQSYPLSALGYLSSD